MDGGAWWAAVHGVAKSQIRLSDFTSYEEFEFKSVDDGEFLNVLNKRPHAKEWSLRKII